MLYRSFLVCFLDQKQLPKSDPGVPTKLSLEPGQMVDLEVKFVGVMLVVSRINTCYS